MRITQERTIITVARNGAGWAVELDGETFDFSKEKEIVMAAAHRRARAMNDGGRACQVRVSGETGYFA
jgi:hypothetical protein